MSGASSALFLHTERLRIQRLLEQKVQCNAGRTVEQKEEEDYRRLMAKQRAKKMGIRLPSDKEKKKDRKREKKDKKDKRHKKKAKKEKSRSKIRKQGKLKDDILSISDSDEEKGKLKRKRKDEEYSPHKKAKLPESVNVTLSNESVSVDHSTKSEPVNSETDDKRKELELRTRLINQKLLRKKEAQTVHM